MKKAFRNLAALLLLSTLSYPLSTASAQGTAFTYQGRLNDAGSQTSGSYDLTFALYDAAGGGSPQGVTLTNTATLVSNGLFTVTLEFGNQFPGADRWLEIGVRTNGGGAFSILTPRQPLTATPYAVRAASAATAATASSVNAANISGIIPVAQLPANVITNGASGVNFSGTFSGNGAGVTNVDLRTVNSLGALSYRTNFTGIFTLASSPGVGNTPISVISADVNGDGKPDLISANTSANTLTVLTNNGSGGFVVASSPGVGNTPISVTSADVNGDGRPDLISANLFDNTLTVLFNTTTFTGKFAGDGSGLTGLNAANLTGTVADAALSANVSKLGSSIDSSEITDGTIVDADISPSAAIADAKLATISTAGKVADTALSTNVALLNRSPQTFSGATNIFTGRVGIGTNAPQQALHVVGNILASGTVTGSSDRNVKRDFAPVDSRAVLEKVAALPISTWAYIADDGIRHLGPMAQDFHNAFNVGLNDKTISMVDADGVALAAIQGLNQKVEREASLRQKLETENAQLKQQLRELKVLVEKLAEKN